MYAPELEFLNQNEPHVEVALNEERFKIDLLQEAKQRGSSVDLGIAHHIADRFILIQNGNDFYSDVFAMQLLDGYEAYLRGQNVFDTHGRRKINWPPQREISEYILHHAGSPVVATTAEAEHPVVFIDTQYWTDRFNDSVSNKPVDIRRAVIMDGLNGLWRSQREYLLRLCEPQAVELDIRENSTRQKFVQPAVFAVLFFTYYSYINNMLQSGDVPVWINVLSSTIASALPAVFFADPWSHAVDVYTAAYKASRFQEKFGTQIPGLFTLTFEK